MSDYEEFKNIGLDSTILPVELLNIIYKFSTQICIDCSIEIKDNEYYCSECNYYRICLACDGECYNIEATEYGYYCKYCAYFRNLI